ncbi:hypothetical protein [Streptomyces sp. NPDC001089]
MTLTVYTVEIFETCTGKTRGFFPVTLESMDELAGLATELVIALNFGADNGHDWRQIAEHPFNQAAPESTPLRAVAP